MAGKKIFVGSLPDGFTEDALREAFSKYGTIVDVFLKPGCESGKQWAFVTYSSAEEAQLAKTSTDRTLTLPGSVKAVEVMLARNQGFHGQDPIVGGGKAAASPAPAAQSQGPTKIFVGSLPDSINETVLKAEFSKYGQIVDVFLKLGQDSGKQWAFITYATNEQAQSAKDATDRVLVMEGASGPCETMFARNQGKNGQDPLAGKAPAAPAAQPPPPSTPMPVHYNGWTSYFTPQGLPYYYNTTTKVTQWECPYEFQYGAMAAQQQAQAAAAAAQAQAQAVYGMYAAAGQAAFRPY
eukprot:TRINITY_DN1918_c5_g1_i1.p1 TRINITY_DN1918_c5_g1~~TRINITY_DN1918_c5_g1_i1.p1  ORF type:complete len:295 (+),score=82.23 TRINITY_DN1918_c5_g1_i1:140-1024(+)